MSDQFYENTEITTETTENTEIITDETETSEQILEYTLEETIGTAPAPFTEPVAEITTHAVVTGNNSEPIHTKKKSGLGRIAMIACLTAAVAGSSLGIGIGVGSGMTSYYASRNLAYAESTTQSNNYSLTSDYEDVSVSAYNPVLLASVTSAKGGVVPIVKKAASSVVSINVSTPVSLFGNRNYYEQQSAGSGVIFAENNENIYIMTNYHVVSGATKVTISVDDDKQVSAHAVGGDPDADIAVIYVVKADVKNAGISYAIASLGDSDSLEVGELVVAIGNAMGEGKTATVGIVSATAKQITIENRAMNLLQTDAAINPGNSGGALVNENGQVVGVNTAKLSETGVEGMGYSIPINDARKIIDHIMAGTYDKQPYFGVTSETITQEIKTANNLPSVGAYIISIEANSAAARAGLRATDIIVGINDTTITSSQELATAISQLKVGDAVKVYIYRNYRTPLIVDLTVGTRYSSMDF